MVNKLILLGRVGRDPEVRYTQSGKCVASFSLATSEKYNGNEQTEWHNIVAWNKLGEICGEYLKKGSLVYLEGKVTYREYDGKDGSKKKITEVIANNMKMMPGNKGSDTGSASGSRSSGASSQSSSQSYSRDDDFVPEDDVSM